MRIFHNYVSKQKYNYKDLFYSRFEVLHILSELLNIKFRPNRFREKYHHTRRQRTRRRGQEGERKKEKTRKMSTDKKKVTVAKDGAKQLKQQREA